MTNTKLYFPATLMCLALGMPTLALAQAEPLSATSPAFTSEKAKTFVAQAVLMGGEDMKDVVTSACSKQPPARVAGVPPAPGTIITPRPAPPPEVGFEPTQVFDNFYYFGSPMVGATAIKTSDGIILIDTLTTSEDAANILVPGLKKVGLDPAQIKYVILTHAHGDHHGGVKYLREHYPQFRVVMSEKDWAFSEKPYYMGDGQPDRAPKPPRGKDDIAYNGSYAVKLGQTTVNLIETPGHTPGTTSLLYPVTSGGRTYTIVQWGGGQPWSTDFSLATVEHFVNAAKLAKPSIRWSSHSNPDTRAKMAQVRAAPGAANPFIEDQSKVERYLDIVLTCKRAAAADETSATARP